MKAVDYGRNVVNVAKKFYISSKRFILFYHINLCWGQRINKACHADGLNRFIYNSNNDIATEITN